MSARACPSRADTATRYKKRSACGRSTVCFGGTEPAESGRSLGTGQSSSLARPSSPIHTRSNSMTGSEPSPSPACSFLGEIAEPSANRPPRLRLCQQRFKGLTGHLFVRIPRQRARALPGQPAGPRRSPQNASRRRNRIGIHGVEPHPHRAPKPLVVSQGSAAIRLRAGCVHEGVGSYPLWARRKFDSGGAQAARFGAVHRRTPTPFAYDSPIRESPQIHSPGALAQKAAHRRWRRRRGQPMDRWATAQMQNRRTTGPGRRQTTGAR